MRNVVKGIGILFLLSSVFLVNITALGRADSVKLTVKTSIKWNIEDNDLKISNLHRKWHYASFYKKKKIP
jgi:hypothetical protein